MLDGAKTVSTQDLAFPRTGLTNKNGETLDSATVPQEIIDGSIELAYELTQSAALEAERNTGSNLKRAKAGSAEVEFFSRGGVDGPSGNTRFPFVVHELVGQFMCGGTGATGTAAYGTDATSQFDDCDTYGLTDPYP